jgi:hypothetical protein
MMRANECVLLIIATLERGNKFGLKTVKAGVF